MSVSTNQNRFSSLGDGANLTFNFPSYFKANPDMLVLVTDNAGNISIKVLDVDYGITGFVTAGFGYKNGADIIFNVAPLVTDTVILINNPVPLQGTILALNSVYPPQKIESTLDSIVLIIQRIFSLVSRAVTLKDGMVDAFDPTLPIDIANIANRGATVIVDPNGGNKFVMGPVLSGSASTDGVEEVDTTGGNVVKTLPAASDGKQFATFINTTFGGAFNVNVGVTGGDTLNGGAGDSLGAGEVGQYWSNGADAWYKIN